jgi:hypothetical protein
MRNQFSDEFGGFYDGAYHLQDYTASLSRGWIIPSAEDQNEP